MRFIIQRVQHAKVDVDQTCVGKIDKGFLVFIGICDSDDVTTADKLIRKLIHLRVFDDTEGKMNLSLNDVRGSLLLVSQFTLYANCKKGNRPSFVKSLAFDQAKELYHYIVSQCKNTGIPVETGVFGADMKVSLFNDGPITIILDSEEL